MRSGEVFAAEIVAGARRPGSGTGRRPGGQARWTLRSCRPAWTHLTREKLGSNALALGKEVTQTGRGILLGNPHYPWTSTDRFYQAHLTVPGPLRYDGRDTRRHSDGRHRL